MAENERDILLRIKNNVLATRNAAQEASKALKDAKEKEEEESSATNPKPIPLKLNTPTQK